MKQPEDHVSIIFDISKELNLSANYVINEIVRVGIDAIKTSGDSADEVGFFVELCSDPKMEEIKKAINKIQSKPQ